MKAFGVCRVMEQIRIEEKPLDKFVVLNALQSCNEALFYHVIMKNLEELAPVIYTPTVGEACQKYDRIFRYTQLLCNLLQKQGCSHPKPYAHNASGSHDCTDHNDPSSEGLASGQFSLNWRFAYDCEYQCSFMRFRI